MSLRGTVAKEQSRTNISHLAEGNRALREKNYPVAIARYLEALQETPALGKVISFNMAQAKQRYRQSRKGVERPRVAVCGWELSHNAAGRVYTLAQLYQTFADTEIIGSFFPKWGRELWEPIRGTKIPIHSFVVEDETRFLDQAVQLVAAHPYDIVHISKPRITNIFFGILYKLIWDAKVLVDIDDEELAFVGAESPISIDEYIKNNGSLPELKDLPGKDWTRLAVGLAKEFDGITVSNPALQQRYGGEIIRHARDEKLFNPSPELKRKSRETFGIPQDKKVVLFFGTPRDHKGLVETAEAIAALKREDVVFVIVGDFPDPRLRQKLQAITSVQYFFIGNQPFDEIHRVVAIGDYCVLVNDPSTPVSNFQVPAKLSDALGMGLTVIVRRYESLIDVVAEKAAIAIDGDLTTALGEALDKSSITTELNLSAIKFFQSNLGYFVNSSRLKSLALAQCCTADCNGTMVDFFRATSLMQVLGSDTKSADLLSQKKRLLVPVVGTRVVSTCKNSLIEIDLIRKSGLFDTSYYLKEYPDVAIFRMDPIEHYLKYGALLLRRTSEKFDTKFYLNTNPDVVAAKINPLLHYIRFGMKEGRIPCSAMLASLGDPVANVELNSLSFVGDRTSRKRLKIGLILQGKHYPTSSGFIRLLAPLTTTQAHECIESVVLRGADDPQLDDCDICIVQRISISDGDTARRLVARLRERDAQLIIDSDDAFSLLPPTHPEKETLGRLDATLRYLISEADDVWFSTEVLQSVYADVAKESRVIPNALDSRIWKTERKSPQACTGSGVLRMIYMGTATHDADFQMIMPALDELERIYPGTFDVTIIGALRTPPQRNWLKVLSPPPQSGMYPRFAQWFVEQGPFDIGLAPLEDNSFNACKSDIKFLDYCALGLLSILSDVPPYRGDVKSRELALCVPNTTEDWFARLEKVLLHRQNFAAMAQRAALYVWEERSALTTVKAMLDSIRSLRFGLYEERLRQEDSIPVAHSNHFIRLRDNHYPIQQRVAIAAHVFYPEIWPELREKLTALKGSFDLFITLPSQLLEEMSKIVTKDFPEARFFEYNGAGMDVGPFLELIPALVEEKYDCVCKIHTKKGNAELGKIWRDVLLDGVIGNHDVFAGIVAAFAQYPELGLVGPAPTYKSAVALKYGNEKAIDDLALKLNAGHNLPSDWGFFAGTMFWARPQIFSDLASVIKNNFSFEQSVTSGDGTLAHAVERIVGLLAALSHQRVGLVHPLYNGQNEHTLEITKNDQYGARGGISETLRRMLTLEEDASLLKQHHIFDPEWYTQTYPASHAIGMKAEHHYLLYGEDSGCSASKDFNARNYLKLCPKVAQMRISPLIHFIRSGMMKAQSIAESDKRGSTNLNQMDSSPPIDDKVYNTIASSPLFDKKWYQAHYDSSLIPGEDLISHYIRVGMQRGFDPGPQFSTSKYLDCYRDIKAAGVNPFYHYLVHGVREGRKPKPEKSLFRFTPAETGVPQIILEFDALPLEVIGIEKEKIAVHLHLFHVSRADEIIYYLANIRYPFTLLISIQTTDDPEYWKNYFARHLPRATAIVVKSVPNQGRNVAPWVVDFKKEIEESTLFCHIHSKRSNHNNSQDGWFRYLSHTILGSASVVDQILDLFCRNQQVGAVGPCYFWALADQPNYGKNRDECEKLYSRLSSRALPNECPDYPAGSFFWIRTKALKPLFALNLTRDDFPAETGQSDGTITHAIERIVGLLPNLTGSSYHMVTVDVAYDLTRFVYPRRERLSDAIQRPRESGRIKHPKVAVFSCISGGYEKPIPLITHKDGVDCFLFSDDEKFSPPAGYEFKWSNYISPIPVRTARFVKTHPHVWFKNYDYACWIDSNVHFFGDIYKYLEILDQSGADCGFIPHPVREIVHEEFQELVKEGIVNQALAEAQIGRYAEIPEVLTAQLIETNFFICRPNSERVVRFMRCWWSEINRFTHRDQLSVNYAIHQSGLKWVNLLEPGRSAREHADFVLFRHDYKDRERVIDFINNGERNVLV